MPSKDYRLENGRFLIKVHCDGLVEVVCSDLKKLPGCKDFR